MPFWVCVPLKLHCLWDCKDIGVVCSWKLHSLWDRKDVGDVALGSWVAFKVAMLTNLNW